MDREALWQRLDDERGGLADLLGSLSDAEWETPSLCAGWRVREVGAHLSLGPTMGLGTLLVEVARARGSFNRMVDNSARRAARTPTPEIVEKLRAVVGSRRLAPGQKLQDAVFDVLVHGQDIAVPLGQRRDMPLDAAKMAAEHLWAMGFPFHTRKRMSGFRCVATDIDWSAGHGAGIRGPIRLLLPLMAGRSAIAADLEGDGAALLAART